jgi:hypothetical protein
VFAKGGESLKRAYISLKYPFLVIHAKGGESMSPKQKDRTTTEFLKIRGRKYESSTNSTLNSSPLRKSEGAPL